MRWAYFTLGLVQLESLLPAQSPRLSVAVVFSDSATGSVFQSGFAAAFRSLGDVEVVGPNDDPDYVLSGVAMCSPDPDNCNNVLSYSVALRLYEPLSPTTAELVSHLANGWHQPAGISPDSSKHAVMNLIGSYERTHREWVAVWGRSRYEEATRKMVRTIDAGCLDKLRAIKRAAADNTSDGWKKYGDYMKSRDWIC